jgi:predicted CXXCH cytochrome family protein
MKKVLILALALLVVAGVAFAAIDGSDHDMNFVFGGGTDETCIYCHHPHSGNVVSTSLLWNRNADTTTYTTYTTARVTLNDDGDDLGANTPSRLCMSCHNGTTALNSVINAGGKTLVSNTADDITPTVGIASDTAGLSNDHPVGIDYSDANAATGATLVDTPVGVILPNDQVECSSCHEPHTTTYGKFLRISNANSALCVACHEK